ncbi:MAG: DUF5050 domain-containing protein [Erysipelotrichaceae bacterium]|nr:DUF5050 domain-containing protein [Erysipelotrichaceae bacterium]
MKEGIMMKLKVRGVILLFIALTLIMLSGCNQSSGTSGVNGNTNANIANGGLAVADDDWIYFINYGDYNALYKINADGTDEQKISTDYAYYLNYYEDWLYYCNASENSHIYKIKPDGTQRTLVSESAARNLTIVDGWMYFVNLTYLDSEETSMTIFKARTDGSGLIQLLDSAVNGFNVAGDWVYYIDGTSKNIYKMKTDGSASSNLSSTQAVMMNVLDDKIYYVDGTDEMNTLWSMNLDGTGATKLSGEKVAGFNVAEDYIYYSSAKEEAGSFEFKKMNLDGSGVAVVNEDSPVLINVIGDTLVYLSLDFSDLISWQVKETIIKTDGTNRHDYVPMRMEDVLDGIGMNGMDETVTLGDLDITVTSAYSTNILKNTTPGFEDPLFDDVSDGTNMFVNLTITNNGSEEMDLTHVIGKLDIDESGSGGYGVSWWPLGDITALATQDDITFHLARENYSENLTIAAGTTMNVQMYGVMENRGFPITLAVYENENIDHPLAAFAVTPDEEYYVISSMDALDIIESKFPDTKQEQLNAIPFDRDGDGVNEIYYTFKLGSSATDQGTYYFVARDSGAIYSGGYDASYPDFEAVPDALVE